MATPENPQEFTKDELIIRAEKVPLVHLAKGRIEELFNVMVEFDFIFKDKDGKDEQQWITVQGSKDGCKLAKDYIKSLSNPNESALVKFPPELYSALTDQGVWTRLEKQSHAVLQFSGGDEVQIMGADPLSVTLAMSALEDIINTFVSSDDLAFEPQSPGTSVSKQGSLRLDQELRRLSSENGSLIIDEDPASMKDEVKRAILGCVMEDPNSGSWDISKKQDFVDIRTGKTVLLPPEAFGLQRTEDPVRNAPSPELMADIELEGAISAGGIGQSAQREDKQLWSFAFDQGYSVTEIEEVFRQHGANLRTSEFLKALVRNRRSGGFVSRSERGDQENKNLEISPTSSSLFDSKGFPTKLPELPILGEKKGQSTTSSTNQNQHSDRSSSRDESLPPGYLAQLHRDYDEEDNCQTEELKQRNFERRKILRAAIDAEPEVHLNSKSDTKASVPQKAAKKRGKKKKNAGKKSNASGQVTKRGSPALDSEEENEDTITNVTTDNTYDGLVNGEYKLPVTDQAPSNKDRLDQPAFVPPQVEFTQWGSLKDDSLCRDGKADKEPDSMPWQVATKKPKGKKSTQASTDKIPGVSYPKVTLHTKSDRVMDGKMTTSPKNNAAERRRSPSPRKGAQTFENSQTYVMWPDPVPGQSQMTEQVSRIPSSSASSYNDPLPLDQTGWNQLVPVNPPNMAPYPGSPPVRNDMLMNPANHIPGIPAPTRQQSVKLRWIVIDGSNVAMTHGNGVFSCKGIQICVDYFLERGHKQITVFVPQWRTRMPKDGYPIRDQQLLNKLKEQGFLTLTPARKVQGKNIVCYDDRFILKLTETTDGIVVSNDNYRDLWREKLEWREIIENRLLMYSFVEDFFMPPDDPLGQNGPTLDEYLSKPIGGPATYFPPHRTPANINPRGQNPSQLQAAQPGLLGAHNHHSTPNLTGGQYYGGFPPNYSVPPPLMQQPPPRGQYPPPNVQWQKPPNVRQNKPKTNLPNVQNRMPKPSAPNPTKDPGSLKKTHSDVEITKWGFNGGDSTDTGVAVVLDAKRTGPRKKQGGQQKQNPTVTNPRVSTQTTALFQQLHDVFPESETQISRILENHPSECNVDKLSAYLLEII